MDFLCTENLTAMSVQISVAPKFNPIGNSAITQRQMLPERSLSRTVVIRKIKSYCEAGCKKRGHKHIKVPVHEHL